MAPNENKRGRNENPQKHKITVSFLSPMILIPSGGHYMTCGLS